MPAGASGIRAGRAYVELYADESALERGLNVAAARVRTFGRSIAGIGASLTGAGVAAATPFAGAVKMFADTGEQLENMSKRTGFSVEALSQLSFAAGQSATDIEEVENAIRHLQRVMVSGSEENINAAGTFAALGMNVMALERMAPERQFEILANRIARIQNPTARAGAAMQLFGKTGTLLLPMIGDFRELTSRAREFNLVWTGEEAKRADALGNAIDLLTSVIRRFGSAIGSALAPMLTDFANGLARAAAGAIGWVRHNREMVVTAFKTTVAVVASGVALTALGVAALGAGKALGILAAGFTLVRNVVMTTVAVLQTTISLFVILQGAIFALTNPITLVGIALVGLGAYLFIFSSNGQKAISALGRGFETLRADTERVFKGIADAIKAGDIELAVQILWAGIRLEWAKGVEYVYRKWAVFTKKAGDLFRDLQFRISHIIVDIRNGLEINFIKTMGTIGDAVTSGVGKIVDAFKGISGSIRAAWAGMFGPMATDFDRFISDSKINAIGLARDIKSEYAVIKSIVTFKGPTSAAAEIKSINEDAEKSIAEVKAGFEARAAARMAEPERIASETGEDLDKRRKDREESIARSRREREGKIGDIGQRILEEHKALEDQAKAESDARHKAADESLKAVTDAKNKAQQELDDLLGIKPLEGEGGGGFKGEGKGGPGGFPLTPRAIDRGMEKAKVDVSGSFSAAALAGLGAGKSVAEDQLSEQKKTNQKLEKLRDDFRRGVPVFGQ